MVKVEKKRHFGKMGYCEVSFFCVQPKWQQLDLIGIINQIWIKLFAFVVLQLNFV